VNPVLIFDIETIPDVAGLRRTLDIEPNASDAEVAASAFAQRKEKTGSDFLPHHLHRVCAISCVLRSGESDLAIWSLGALNDDEPTIIKKFFSLVERYTPQLVSWNGGGFDLPVLHYRSLVHGLDAARYWDWGDDDRDFKWNNYLSRYHTRHLDLMDVLALYQPRAFVGLDDLAKLCGLPGKLGMDGSQVWPAYQRGELADIRAYCETDVANTYLMFLRFQRMRGVLSAEQRRVEELRVHEKLETLPGEHWKRYLAAWKVS
jgi:3'-5' exonuclease